MNQQNKSARQNLLPFDGIYSKQQQQNIYRPSRISEVARALHPQKQNHQQNITARLRLLSKIRDPSFQILSRPKSRLQLFLEALDEKYPLLKPEYTFMFFWNLFMVVAILLNFFEIPISLFMTEQVYYDQFNNPVPLAINIIFLIALAFDTFFIRFNLAYYKLAKLITSRNKIFDKYIKFQFWIDLVTTIALFVYIVGGQPRLIYVKFLFYLKIISLLRIDQQLLNYLIVYRIGKGMYKLFRIVLLIWFIATWVSAVYFAMDYAWYQENGFYRRTGQLWLTNSNAVGNINLIQTFPHWYIWYQYAIYWSFQTSSTVGYGNMTPRNPPEVLYCDFIIVLNTVLFAFYINSIWQIISQMQQAQQRYSQNWSNLKQLIKSQKLPTQTSQKISDYLHEIWTDQDKQQIQQKLHDNLSQDLSIQLNLTAKSRFYNKIPLFIELSSASPQSSAFFKKLVFLIQKDNSAINQDIYKVGDNPQYLYYLLRGKIKLYAKQINSFDFVTIGQNFGIEQFVLDTKRISSAQTSSFCTFFKLSSEKFIDLLRQFGNVYERYCMLRHTVIFGGQYLKLGIQCLYCRSKFHMLTQCRVLNNWRKIIRQPLQVLKAYNPGIDSPRINYIRKDVKNPKIRYYTLKNQIDSDQVYKYNGYWSEFNMF